MLRGANFDKQLLKVSPKARRDLTALKNKYGIVACVTATSTPTTVTGGRILATFPLLCSQLCEANVYRNPVTAAHTCEQKFMFFSAPSLFRTEDEFSNWLTWATLMDGIVNKDKANPESVAKFGRIAMQNSPFNKQ
jgi:hypothetical protein